MGRSRGPHQPRWGNSGTKKREVGLNGWWIWDHGLEPGGDVHEGMESGGDSGRGGSADEVCQTETGFGLIIRLEREILVRRTTSVAGRISMKHED